MVRSGTDVNPHRPDLGVLWVTILVDLWVGVSMRRPTTTWPVHSGHVEIDVIRDRDFRMVLLHVIFGPIVGTAFAPFLSRPQAEHHRPTRLEAS